jgi:hypothetical protein
MEGYAPSAPQSDGGKNKEGKMDFSAGWVPSDLNTFDENALVMQVI